MSRSSEPKDLVSAHKGLSSGMREFLLFLFWVQELVAFCLAHIEPSHNGLGLGIPTISQRDRNFGVNPLTLAGNRKHSPLTFDLRARSGRGDDDRWCRTTGTSRFPRVGRAW